MKPYYQDDLVTLYHGDCREVLLNVSDVSLFVTSPPYNLGVSSGGGFGHYKPGQNRGGQGKWGGTSKQGITYLDHDDAMPFDAYCDWQSNVIQAMWDSLGDKGAIFYNHKPRVQRGQLWMPTSLVRDLPVRQIITWVRAGGMNFAPTHYVPTYEWIVVIAKDGWRLKSKAASGLGDVWRINQESNPDHPAPFPVALPAAAIETTAPSLVADPFSGSGTTLIAAKAAGVPAVGIELSERYCEIAAKRLAQDAFAFDEDGAA